MGLHGHRPETSALKPMNIALDENSTCDDNQQNEEYQNNTSGSKHAVTATATTTTSFYFTHLRIPPPSVDYNKSPEIKFLS